MTALDGRHNRIAECPQSASAIDTVESKVADLYRTIAIPEELRVRLEASLLAELDIFVREAADVRRRLTRQQASLENKRLKLLHAHFADAVPVDLLKAENESIASQMVAINERLAAANVKIESVQDTLATALTLARDCYGAYCQATGSVRRLMNQAFFERIEVKTVDENIEVKGELAEPFRTCWRQDMKNPVLFRNMDGVPVSTVWRG